MHPTGGTAYLSLENSEEPFLGGVKFTAMPPTKRFRDMEQLSGGEKARPLPLPYLPMSYLMLPYPTFHPITPLPTCMLSSQALSQAIP